jgi:predicted metal-dependent hydrolase
MADLDTTFAHGAALFNAGRFFAAHEIWEQGWLEAAGSEREILQALVQIAAGYAKVESGLRSGALKLLTRGLERLQRALTPSAGPQLHSFIDDVGADLARVRRADDSQVTLDLVHPPRLDLEAPW